MFSQYLSLRVDVKFNFALPHVCVSAGDALVSSGIMESLLQVLDWKAFEPMNITVSNAVVIMGKGDYSEPLYYVCSW